MKRKTNESDPAPVTVVIAHAEDTNRRAGHENAGPLSLSHGFMPVRPPLLALPPSHAAWDELAAELPAHFRDLSLRRRLEALPLLSAEPGQLPDVFLLRAAAILGMFAHAHHSVETFLPRTPCPPSVRAPWETVRRRLGRPEEVLTYIDNIVYNWRLEEPSRAGGMRLENLQLLLPTVDTPEERIFYLTQTEILAGATPIVGAIARAQAAVLAESGEDLLHALVTIGATLQDLRDRALQNIDPRPTSATFQNPVVWAKSVAPLSVPVRAGLHGPSGTNSPLFATLDLFFERKRYQTILGQELLALRAAYPPHWRMLLDAVAATSVRAFIDARGDTRLTAAWNDALAHYAGAGGFLARHRMKVYGYMEVAFRVGRSVTIGGFAGRSGERVWRRVDQELEASRRERLPAGPPPQANRPPRPAVPPRATGPSETEISVAEFARHNDETAGYWLAIGGEVHDVTDYLRVHPGGPAILALYAGTDATEAFARVHARSADVARLRAGLRLGRLETSSPGAHPRLGRLAKAVYAINSVQNSLRLDLSFQDQAAQRGDPGATATPYKLQRFVESHQRFLHNDVDTLRDAILSVETAGAGPPAAETPWPPPSARQVIEALIAVAVQVPDLVASGSHQALSTLHQLCAEVAVRAHAAVAAAKRFLLHALRSVREGERVEGCAQTEALAALAGYLGPVCASPAFQSLSRTAAMTANSAAEASPLWLDHDIMRVRPH